MQRTPNTLLYKEEIQMKYCIPNFSSQTRTQEDESWSIAREKANLKSMLTAYMKDQSLLTISDKKFLFNNMTTGFTKGHFTWE